MSVLVNLKLSHFASLWKGAVFLIVRISLKHRTSSTVSAPNYSEFSLSEYVDDS